MRAGWGARVGEESAFVGDALGVSMGVLRDLPGVRGEINNALVDSVLRKMGRRTERRRGRLPVV